MVTLFLITPVELLLQVPVPPNTIAVVPEYIPPVVCVKLPFILSVLFVRVVVPLPENVTVPVEVQLPTNVYV